MSRYTLRRFAQPDMLKNLDQYNLYRFLKRYNTYLIERGFTLDKETLDVEHLSHILLNPSEKMPVSFVEAMFFIQEMSDDASFEVLREQAESHKIEIKEEASTADLALSLWLQEPERLKRLHAEVVLLKPKTLMYFQSSYPSAKIIRSPKPDRIRKIEEEMSAWFVANKRGIGCRVLTVIAEEEGKLYFLIRHGMPFKREGKIEQGQSTSIFYRPEFHDVLVYDRKSNEVSIFNKSGSKKERQMYLEVLGSQLFGEKDYFIGIEKYTLQPLIDQGRDALSCADIEGIEAIQLVEIQLQFYGPYNDRQIIRSNDMLASLSARGKEIPNGGKLVAASFSVKFSHAPRARRVKIKLPNVANFDRKEDAHLIEQWLRLRGFTTQVTEQSSQPSLYQESHDEIALTPLA